MSKRIAIVCTSIGDDKVFSKFFESYQQINLGDNKVRFIIIGDKNTPEINFKSLPSFKKFNEKFDFSFISAKEQKEIMRLKPYMDNLIPWKRIQRRNIGYLIAYKEKYDYIITVDDDNFPLTSDFLEKHIKNLETIQENIYDTDEKFTWMNPCFKLKKIIHRGYPIELRHKKLNSEIKLQNNTHKCFVSEGFWFGDPDIDALSRLDNNNDSIVVKENDNIEEIAISNKIISPFNTQNTAFRSELIPAMFLSSKNGRYDDIWASYFTKAILYLKKGIVTYGKPVVQQDRNDHDIFKDLEKEIYGMKNTKLFVEELFNYIIKNKQELETLEFLELTKKIAKKMIVKSINFSWYYLDVLRWCKLLEIY